MGLRKSKDALEHFGVSHFKKKTQSEADSLTAFPALSRDGVRSLSKESQSHTAPGNVRSSLRLIEAEANPVPDNDNPSRFRVVLIQEGLGNFGDCYYYTRGALEQSVNDKIFEGKKCFANHPDTVEEHTRPERDVKDIIGHFENCMLSESQGGQAQIVSDLVVLPGDAFDYARALMAHSVAYSKKYQDQDFIGLSINANGDATETGLEQFMRETAIPEGAKEKLLEAVAQGIATIRPVSRLTSAVSCDLVTEAGAGGRIAQMLEQEKNRMSVKVKAKEAEEQAKKEADEKADKKEGDAPAPKSDGGGDDSGDGDADDDQDLIKKMLLKYLGDGHDEATHSMAKEAYEAYKEMGMDENEAMKSAGNSMKLAKHMAGKKPADGAAAPAPSVPAGQAPASAPQEAAPAQSDPSKLAAEAKKESDKVLSLTAENAKLKERIKKAELVGCEGALDKILRESKLPMAVTKKFRECLGDATSEQEIKDKFKIFQEAYSVRGEADVLSGFTLPEKTTTLRESGGLDLSDCVKKDN